MTYSPCTMEYQEAEEENDLADFLSENHDPSNVIIKQRTRPSKSHVRNLLTISESSEALHSLLIKEISAMDNEETVPSASPAVDGGEKLDVEVYNDDNSEESSISASSSSSEMVEVSEELSALKDRAKKLSEELKMLSIPSRDEEEDEGRVDPLISDDKIRKLIQDSNPREELSEGRNIFERTKRSLAPASAIEDFPPKPDNEEGETPPPPKPVAERLNFDRRGPPQKVEKPSFLDLSLEGEKQIQNCRGGARYWQMPFREKLYFESKFYKERELDWTDPIFYAPTGDIYSYFKRRQLYPHPFFPPTTYVTKKALGS